MKNNIKKFNSILKDINNSIIELAKLYTEDLDKDPKSEQKYIAETKFTRTMLRRLVKIARGVMTPESFFIGNATAYRAMTTMSIQQQDKCIYGNVEIVAEDGSYWSKKFEDLSPRQMNMVYDQKAKVFRSLEAQKEWLKSNPVVRVSKAGVLKPIEVKQEEVKPKKQSKTMLINALKKMSVTSKDLAKLADAQTLMEAAQEALRNAANKTV